VRAQTHYEEARPLLERAAAIYRRLGDGSGLVRCLTNLGYAHLLLDDAAAADAAYVEALAAARSSGSTRDRCITLSCLADLALRGGDYARVEELVAEGLELAREAGDTESVAVCLMNRAHAAYGAGRMRDALAVGAESVRAWAALGDEGSGAWALDVVAAACAAEAPAPAARLLAAADAARVRAGLGLDAFELEVHRHGEREAAARLDDAVLAAETARGAQLSFAEAMAEALAAAEQTTYG
jgi:hypothetical protein